MWKKMSTSKGGVNMIMNMKHRVAESSGQKNDECYN
jgi:hypothetical protein